MKPMAGAVPIVLGALSGAAVTALAMWLLVPREGGGAAEPHAVEAPDKAEAGSLQLDDKAREAAGIKVAPLAAMTLQGDVAGFAKGLDLSPLASIASDIVSAQAAAAASGREEQRLVALAGADQSASRREVEAARAAAQADRAKLALACQRVTLEFGAGIARLGCGAIPGFVREAAAGEAALVRIDIAGAALPPGAAVEIGSGGDTARVTVLGAAATGDPQLQTAGVLALLRGRQAGMVPIGRVLPARVGNGQAQTGVLIPREAIVRTDGGRFVYRDGGRDGFARVSVDDAASAGAGWFLAGGDLKPGDRVAVGGAGTLLGLEHAAPAEAD